MVPGVLGVVPRVLGLVPRILGVLGSTQAQSRQTTVWVCILCPPH